MSPQSLVYLQTFWGAVHEPATHTLPPVQSLFDAHGHGPFVPPHAWQWFATHALPLPQSAVVLQPFAVHVPEMHLLPLTQSPSLLHVHAAPPSTPHATQWLPVHVLPTPQSAFVEHSFGAPASRPGATQRFDWHTVPCGQSTSVEHFATHP
jgi:hypothetical protein